MNYNNLTLVGRLTKDGETRFLPNGNEVYANSIAVSKKYKTKQGEAREEAMFMDFSCFNGLATTCKNYLKKGSLVLLSGEIKQETWTAQDGTNRSKHSLRVDTMKMLDSKQDNYNQGYSNPQQQGNNYNQSNSNPPVEYQRQQPNIPEVDVDSDSIPF